MASVITMAVSSGAEGAAGLTPQAVIITIIFTIGMTLPMAAVMFGGRVLIKHIKWLKINSSKIQRVFAALILIAGISIAADLDRKFQSAFLDLSNSNFE